MSALTVGMTPAGYNAMAEGADLHELEHLLDSPIDLDPRYANTLMRELFTGLRSDRSNDEMNPFLLTVEEN